MNDLKKDKDKDLVVQIVFDALFRMSRNEEDRWWQGVRGIEMRNYQPYYVKVVAESAPCMALNGQPKTPATTCPRWSKWEKL